MPKTTDEIKKGLECCRNLWDCKNKDCPYLGDGCYPKLHEDFKARMEQLQADNAEKDQRIRQLEADLEAMKDEIDCDCETCKHREACQDDGYCIWCENKESNKTPCCNCVYFCNWEWRGVQKEE